MIPRLISLVTVLAALGSGLIGGVFFAFSSFVLPALARLPGLQGLAAMQSINVVVLNRSFLGTFVGTAFACALLLVDALARWSAPGAKLRLAGSLLYLLGSLLVTMELNVPWNEVLARIEPQAPGAARSWASFVAGWSRWNQLRTAASILAAALLIVAASGCSRYSACSPPPAAQLRELPERLSQTGLFPANSSQSTKGQVLAFAPLLRPRNGLDLWLTATRLPSVADTPTYQSGRGVAFEPGRPDESRMLELMASRGLLQQMPPLGSEQVDSAGLGAVGQWVTSLE